MIKSNKFKSIIIVLLVVVYSSCSKDKTLNPNTISYRINNELFTQESALSKFSAGRNGSTLYFSHIIYNDSETYESTESGYRNKFSISNIKMNYEKQIINGDANNIHSLVAYMQLGGESPCMIFEVDTTMVSEEFFLQITTANADFSNVQGVFQETLIKTYDCPDYDVADTLHITEGKFHFVLE